MQHFNINLSRRSLLKAATFGAIAFSKYPTNNTPLDERFEYIERIWNRWQERDSFKKAYADGMSGLAELDHLKNA